MDIFSIGSTVRTESEFPQGVPCIIYDGDSVLCEFRSIPDGMKQAIAVCEVLNASVEFLALIPKEEE